MPVPLTLRLGAQEGKAIVELFRNVNIDWLGKKWYFLGFSLIFSVAGLISMGVHLAKIGTPVPLGVDFRGGTQVQVQFQNPPDVNAIRSAMADAGVKDARIVTYDRPELREMLIGLPEQSDATVDSSRKLIVDALTAHYNKIGRAHV